MSRNQPRPQSNRLPLIAKRCAGDEDVQKQPSIGALQKRCSAKTQQIYRRSPMKKCDFNKVHSKNSSINLHFWECQLVWMVLRLKS